MKYTVKRQHYGDRLYLEGEERNANPSEVAHLVDKGVLEIKEMLVTQNKKQKVSKNKLV